MFSIIELLQVVICLIKFSLVQILKMNLMTDLIREVCCTLNNDIHIYIYMTKISCVVANIEQNGIEFVMAGGPLAVPLMSGDRLYRGDRGILFLQFSITDWLPNY